MLERLNNNNNKNKILLYKQYQHGVTSWCFTANTSKTTTIIISSKRATTTKTLYHTNKISLMFCYGIFKFRTFSLCIAGIFSWFRFCLFLFFTLANVFWFPFPTNQAGLEESGTDGDRNRTTQKYYRIKMDVWTMIMWNESTWQAMTHFFWNFLPRLYLRLKAMRNGIWFGGIEGF